MYLLYPAPKGFGELMQIMICALLFTEKYKEIETKAVNSLFSSSISISLFIVYS